MMLMKSGILRLSLAILTVGILAGASSVAATAQSPYSVASIPGMSGLVGDWGGLRSGLADKGVTIDAQYTSSFQGLVSGDGEDGSDYGGKVDTFINLESGKMGLWEGSGLRTHIEYRHGDARPNLGNTFFATNTAQLWPVDAPAGILTVVPTFDVLMDVFGLGQIVWFTWLGIVMLRGNPSAT